jgi:hypothetical protein
MKGNETVYTKTSSGFCSLIDHEINKGRFLPNQDKMIDFDSYV